MKATSEFDVYVPLIGPARTAYPRKLINAYKKQIINEFGSLTDFRHSFKGIWRLGGVEFRDRVVLWRILADEPRSARRFIRDLKRSMERSLKQKTILVVERRATILT